MRLRITSICCALTGAALLGLLPASAQAVSTSTPPPQTISTTVRGHPTVVQFVRPRPDRDDRTIVNEAVRLIKSVPPGGAIRSNIFTLTRFQVTRALIAAHDRGVDVKVTLAGRNTGYAAAGALISALGPDVVVCPKGCISGSRFGLAHNKYMTFSSATTPAGVRHRSVVWVSSANFSASSERRNENAVTTYADRRAYLALNRVFSLAFRQVHFPGNDFYTGKPPSFWVGYSGLRGFHSPEQQTDLWYHRLKWVEAGPGCTVRLQAVTWRVSRLAVAELLVEKARAGCYVRVGVSTIDAEVLATLQAGGIPVQQTVDAHHKFAVVHARYAGSASYRYLTWAGSQNLTTGGNYYQDEIIVRVESKAVAMAFIREFDLLQGRGVPL